MSVLKKRTWAFSPSREWAYRVELEKADQRSSHFRVAAKHEPYIAVERHPMFGGDLERCGFFGLAVAQIFEELICHWSRFRGEQCLEKYRLSGRGDQEDR